MDIRPLPHEEAVVGRIVEELWLPYNRELEATVDGFALADDVDLLDEEVPFRLDRLESEDYEGWVAIDGSTGDGPVDVADLADADLAGFVTTDRDVAPSVFDRPDRLTVCDIYVRESYRGSGLARDLIDRAAERARAEGCEQLRLDVDVDNERAIAFYEKLGFEPYRRQMAVDVEEL